MVGDHWGGWGKDHWGCPHIEHESGGWQYCHHGLRGNHEHGSSKSIIPDCCKVATNPEISKRCGCKGHTGGYHFHDKGSGHRNHDHDLQGAWTFGYDHFGDDWHDWDHNHHNLEHLQHMNHGCHCGNGRACIPLVQPAACNNNGVTAAPAQMPIEQTPFIAPSAVFGADANNNLNQNGVYHVCHDCQNLPYGGSRCLCKNIRRPVNALVPQYQRHVYMDCDSAVHRFPFQSNCVARTDLPVPKKKISKKRKRKQR